MRSGIHISSASVGFLLADLRVQGIEALGGSILFTTLRVFKMTQSARVDLQLARDEGTEGADSARATVTWRMEKTVTLKVCGITILI